MSWKGLGKKREKEEGMKEEESRKTMTSRQVHKTEQS